MADKFVAFIDEAGGWESVIDLSNFQEHANPYETHCFVGAIILRAEAVDDFFGEWNSLRSEIARSVELDYLPSIHARFMWGTRLQDKMHGRPNPYALASREQIEYWVNSGLKLISRFSTEKGKRCLWFHEARYQRSEFARQLLEHYNSDLGRIEAEFLRSTYKRGYAGYHRFATSPLAFLLAVMLYDLNIFTKQKSGWLEVLLDNSEEYSGIDNLAIMTRLREIGSLHKIESVNTLKGKGTSFANSPGHQAADLRLYFVKRAALDPKAHTLLAGALVQHHRSNGTDIPYDNTRRDENFVLTEMLLRYELARKQGVGADSRLDKVLVDHSEFEQRVKRREPTARGVSVLKAGILNSDVSEND